MIKFKGASGHVGQGLSDHDNNVKESFFHTFFQKWAYFPGVEFTIVQNLNDPRPQMIPMDLKWSSTVNDPSCRPQMIQKGKSECMAWT